MITSTVEMKLTKYTHACVRLEADERVLVIDPGVWTEPEAFHQMDAILVTHEHVDHVDLDRVAASGVPIFAPRDADLEGLEFHQIRSGDGFDVAGFKVRAVGDRHARVYGPQPDCANLGYVIDDALYHPGDALVVPWGPIETLLLPIFGPFLKTSEAIDFARAVKPDVAIGIHDGQLNERGTMSVGNWIAKNIDTIYKMLSPGQTH